MKNIRFRPHYFLAAFLTVEASGGVPLSGIVNHSFAPAFEGSAVPTVYATLVRPDNRIIATGDFIRFNGSTALNITALDPAASGFNPVQPPWPVYCAALQDDGKVLIGGKFNPNGYNVLRLKPDGSEEEREFFNLRSNPNGDVYSIALHPDGRIVFGGAFTNFGDQPRGRIAVINPDGSPNAAIGNAGGTNGTVNSVAVQADGKIVAAGNFTTAGGQPRNRIARWNADGSLDATFNPGTGPNAAIQCLLLQPDGAIIIGGDFTNVSGQARNRIARLSAAGAVSVSSFNPGTGFNAPVLSMALTADGYAYAGGAFTTANGITVNRIARVSPSGTLTDFAIGDGPNNTVDSVTLENSGSVLFGGKFTIVSGVAHKGMARVLNIDDTQRFSITGGNLVWHRAASAPAPAYVTFDTSIDGGLSWQRLGVATYYGGGDWELRNPMLPPSCIVRAHGRVQCGWHNGSTGLITDATAYHPAILDAAFNPNVSVSSSGVGVNAVAFQPDGKIVIGGGFFTVGGQPRNRLARVHADGTLESTATFSPGAGPEADTGVFSLALQADEKILASGSFSRWNSQDRRSTARFSPAGLLEPLASYNVTATVGGSILCSAVQPDGKVLLGGGYYFIGNGQTQPGIVRVNANGTSESSATWQPVAIDGYVTCLLLQPDGRIIIGGNFSEVNGQPRGNIARLLSNGSLESTAAFNATGSATDQSVDALCLQPDGQIIVGGNFVSFNGQTRFRLARLNPDGSLESQATFNTSRGPDSSVHTVLLQADGKILVCGGFRKFGDQPFDHLVRLHPDGTPESAATFNPGVTAQGMAIALQADGDILAYGLFSTFGEVPRNGMARLKNDPALLTLAPSSRSRVTWLRGGTAPEVSGVRFELSDSAGLNWTLLGRGTRIPGGWELSGLSLPSAGRLRARGRVHDSTSEGIVQSTGPFIMEPEITVFSGSRDSGVELTDAQVPSVAWPEVKRATVPEPELLFTIWNSGAESLNITGITLPPSYFMPSLPSLPAIIAPGATLSFAVKLSTANGGTFGGSIVIQSNDSNEPSFDFPVSGTILTPEITLRALDAEGQPEVLHGQVEPVDLGFTRQGDSRAIRIGVSNPGQASLIISGLSATPPFSARLVGVQPPPRTIDPGRSSTFSITLDGSVAGTFTGQVTITSDDPDEGTFQFPVTGSVLTPEIGVHDGDLTGPQLTDDQAAPVGYEAARLGTPLVRIFTVINTGTLPMSLKGLVAPGGFSFLNPPALPAHIPIGESVVLRLQLNAEALGSFGGNVRISSDDFDEEFFDFPVTGRVITPDISLREGGSAGPEITDGQATPVSFGRNIQGTPGTRSFTITNTGTAELLVSSVTLPPGYTALNVPPLPLTVGISESATFQISLTTLTVGTHAGSVVIASDDLDEASFDFPVTGEVFIPDPVSSVVTTTTTLNRQTGLREQTIHIANDTTATVPAYNLIIRGLPPGVEVNNASETRADGSVVVYIRQEMSPHSAQDIVIEYYSPNRAPVEINPQLSTEVILNPVDLSVPGEVTAFRIDVVKAVPGGVLVEFPTTPGSRYQVQYSTDGTNWQASLPSIRAAATRTQWVDRGLPRTDSPPASKTSRFYRVAELSP